jgi:hypothetical protein
VDVEELSSKMGLEEKQTWSSQLMASVQCRGLWLLVNQSLLGVSTLWNKPGKSATNPFIASGDAIFRASYPVEQAIADPAIAERFPLLEHGRSLIELWVGEGFVATFWRSEDEMQVTLQHPVSCIR